MLVASFRSRRARPCLALVLAALTTVVPATATHADGGRPALPPLVEAPPGPVHDVGVGGALPSEATCAARVQSAAESRPENRTYNNTRGSSPNNENPRVTGNFVGTTDEIIQWAACKWGLDVQWARAQALIESWWIQTTVSDFGTDASGCLPGHPIGADGRAGQCPQSVGLLQVRYPYHQSAFENNNAIRSTAYNADYAWSIWRRCFNGEYTWLNDVEHGRTYAAGDGLGCMGVWFSGRWYTDAAVGYMNRVTETAGGLPSSTTTPSAPTRLRVAVAPTVGVYSGQVRIAWDAPTSDGGAPITGYGVQYSLDGVNWSWFYGSMSMNRSYVATGLTNGRTYRFRVRAKNSVGWGAATPVLTATPNRGTTPQAPGRLRVAVAPTVGVYSGQVRIAWDAPYYSGGTPITGYGVQYSLDGVNWSWFYESMSMNRSYVATGLTNGRTYRFRVRARNSVGWGAATPVVTATPSRGTTPQAPTGLTAASGVGSGQIRLTWNAPYYNGGTPITSYGVQYSLDGVHWSWFFGSWSTSRTYTATGLSNGQAYRFRVLARNSVGWGARSSVVIATPRASAQLSAAVTTSTVPPTTTAPTSTLPPTTVPPPVSTAPATTSTTLPPTTTTLAPTTTAATTTAPPTTAAPPTTTTTTMAPPTTTATTTTTTTVAVIVATPFQDGTWLVGTDVQAGTYRSAVPADSAGCTWERRAGFSDDPADVITSGVGAPGELVTVEIEITDAGFVSSGCGTWEPVG